MPDQPKTFEEARAQAAQYLGFIASEYIRTTNGEVFEIPSPNMYDDEQQSRIDQLALEVESWDRSPDKLNEDGSVRTKGELLEPNRKDGELVENYNIQRAKAIFGERYPAFKAGGGKASDVALIHWKMNRMLADRREADSKSAGSTDSVDLVPDSD
jgi:hypothetical protein